MRSPKIITSMSSQQQNQQIKNTTQISSAPIKINQEQKMKIMQVKHKYEKMYNDYIGQTSVLTGDKIKKIVAEN